MRGLPARECRGRVIGLTVWSGKLSESTRRCPTRRSGEAGASQAIHAWAVATTNIELLRRRGRRGRSPPAPAGPPALCPAHELYDEPRAAREFLRAHNVYRRFVGFPLARAAHPFFQHARCACACGDVLLVARCWRSPSFVSRRLLCRFCPFRLASQVLVLSPRSPSRLLKAWCSAASPHFCLPCSHSSSGTSPLQGRRAHSLESLESNACMFAVDRIARERSLAAQHPTTWFLGVRTHIPRSPPHA